LTPASNAVEIISRYISVAYSARPLRRSLHVNTMSTPKLVVKPRSANEWIDFSVQVGVGGGTKKLISVCHGGISSRPVCAFARTIDCGMPVTAQR
jgi:hypothetical protein